MNNFVNNPVSNTTPIKRVGLSRKRKSLCDFGDTVKESADDCAKTKFTKQDDEVSGNVGTSEEKKLCGRFKEDVNNTVEADNPKSGKNMENDIAELESLNLTWKNGFKSAFLYLLNKLNEVQTEKVNVKELIKQLGVSDVISKHFADDSDFDFCASDND